MISVPRVAQLLASLALASLLCGQMASRPSVPSDAPHNLPQLWQLSEPPVPPDPLEPLTASAEPVETLTQRDAVIRRLTDAFRQCNPGTPYDRKISFVSSGSTPSDGAWQLEDAVQGTSRRWAARGPSYSVVNLLLNNVLYSSQAAGSVPTRLAQVLGAISGSAQRAVTPRDTLRVSPGTLNGEAIDCILYSYMGGARGVIGGRRWDETEYCLNHNSGALTSLSPAPGLYVFYDYSRAIHFHDRLIPNRFQITQAGQVVIEGTTVSVSEPSANSELFQTAGLSEIGVGPPLSIPLRSYSVGPWPASAPKYTTQIVIIHAMKSASGIVSDVEILASSNSASNTIALGRWSGSVQNWQRFAPNNQQPGATPQAQEVFHAVYLPEPAP